MIKFFKNLISKNIEKKKCFEENTFDAFFDSEYFQKTHLPIAALNSKFEIISHNESFEKEILHKFEENIFQDQKKQFVEMIEIDEASLKKDFLKNVGKSPSIKLILENNTSNKHFELQFSLKNFKKENSFIVYIDIFENQQTNSKENDQIILIKLINNIQKKKLELNLAHSQKMHAIGELAGGIAHDFNNLLTAISGFSELLLLKHPAGDSSFPEIIQIKQNATRATNLVKQLLAFSRKQILNPCFFEINNSLFNITDLLKRLIGENIFLNLELNSDCKFIKLDQGQFEQMIINIIINARDAINENKIQNKSFRNEIGIKTFCKFVKNFEDLCRIFDKKLFSIDPEELLPNNYIIIEIKDNGTGIKKENLDKIFEPFFSTKKIKEGTGLGLAMAFGIIKQSLGFIYLSSSLCENEHGTSFYILLRAYDENDEIKKQNLNLNNNFEQKEFYSQKNIIKQMNSFESYRILLVEDEDPVRDFVQKALENKGYKVYPVKNAENAIQFLDEFNEKIDLIITDVIMPGMNGCELIQHVSQYIKDLNVIFISGYTEDSILNKINDLDIKNYYFLTKPFGIKKILSTIEKFL